MAKSQHDGQSHFQLKDLFQRIHRFIKIRRLKRRLSKSSLATACKQQSLSKHERLQSLTSNRTHVQRHRCSHEKAAAIELEAAKDDTNEEDGTMKSTLALISVVASPRKAKSLNLMPNLSTPNSSKRWRISVMRSLDLSASSRSVVDDTPSRRRNKGATHVASPLQAHGSVSEAALQRQIPPLAAPSSAAIDSLDVSDYDEEKVRLRYRSARACGMLGRPDTAVKPDASSPGSSPPTNSPQDMMTLQPIERLNTEPDPSRVGEKHLNLSQASSIHIHRMGISRILRTASNFSYSDQSGGYASEDSRLRLWNRSSSGFGSEDAPKSWGQVLDQGDDIASSSVYSSSQASPRRSIDEGLALPSLNLVVSRLHAMPTADGTSDTSLEPLTESKQVTGLSSSPLPTVSSTSSLGKESRFREELDLLPDVRGTVIAMDTFAGAVADSGKQMQLPISRTTTLSACFPKNGAAGLHPTATETQIMNFPCKSALQEPERAIIASDPGPGMPLDKAIYGTRSRAAGDSKSDGRVTSGAVLPAFLGVLQDLRATRERRKSALALLKDDDKRASTSPEAVSRLEVPRFEADTNSAPDMRKASAASLLDKAVRATEAERSAFLLPQNKSQATIARVRPRSASFCPPPAQLNMALIADRAELAHVRTRHNSDSALRRPSAVTDLVGATIKSPQQQEWTTVSDQLKVLPSQPMLKEVAFEVNTPKLRADATSQALRHSWPVSKDFSLEPVGAWGRYPSHTRAQRSGSADIRDRVIVRDFAFEIDPEPIIDAERTTSDLVNDSPRRPRIGLQKKGPMSRAREVLRNYKLFLASPNVEYLQHGHGRRTSINPGGELFDEPDLEAIPDVTIPIPRAGNLAPPQSFNLGAGKSAFEARPNRQHSMAISVADSMLSPGTSVYHKPYTIDNPPHQMDGHLESIELSAASCSALFRPDAAHQRNESIMSIRQSSYDLLQKLQESEATARQKAFSA